MNLKDFIFFGAVWSQWFTKGKENWGTLDYYKVCVPDIGDFASFTITCLWSSTCHRIFVLSLQVKDSVFEDVVTNGNMINVYGITKVGSY